MYSKERQCKIYKISSPQTDKIYIGSTTMKLSKRFSDHKIKYRQYIQGLYNYTSSFDLISKYDDCKIDCLYRFKSIDKKEVLRKEKEYIEMYKDIIVNKYSPIKC
jgi:hypothetical protein